MPDASRPRFVDNRPAGFIALGLTGLACYLTIKAYLHPQPLQGSMLLMKFPAGSASSMVIGTNIVFEVVFTALIIGVAISVRGWERILVFSCSALIFLTQLLYLLPEAVAVIRSIKIICAFVSLAAAVALCVQVEASKRQNTNNIELR
jgi:hypothetical protein